MSINARSILIAVANLFALFVVIGVCSQGTLLNAKNAASETAAVNLAQEEPSVEQAADLPMITERQTRAKGKGKGSMVEEIDCIPLYPTPAPTKGKGMNGRGGRRARGMNGKGKGKTDAPVSLNYSFKNASKPLLLFTMLLTSAYLQWMTVQLY